MSAYNAFYRAIRKYHTILGVLVAVHLIILSLSGLVLLFKAEAQRANKNIISEINHLEFAQKYDQAQQFLLRHYQNDKLLDIYPDEHNPKVIQARLGKNGSNKVRGARIVNIDYDSGQEVLATELPYSKLYDWLLTLHHQLFLGANGQIYIGVVGIAFILMNLTGLVVFLKKRKYKATQQIQWAKYLKIHQYLGMICLCWGLLVGMTGTLLAFNPIFTQDFQKNTLHQLAKKYQLQEPINQPDTKLQAVIQTAFKTKPNSIIWYIIFPGMERGIKDHYLVLVHNNGFLSQYSSEYLIINAKTAVLKQVVHLPLFMRLALVATPLHTANYGGLLVKIIWTIFGLAMLIYVASGITIFYIKKRLKAWITKIPHYA